MHRLSYFIYLNANAICHEWKTEKKKKKKIKKDKELNPNVQ